MNCSYEDYCNYIPDRKPAKTIFNGVITITLKEFMGVYIQFLDYLEIKLEVIYVLLKRAGEKIKITHSNIFRLLLATAIIAAKFFQDRPHNFSRLLNLKKEDVRSLEREFLLLLEYKIFIDEEETMYWTNVDEFLFS